MNDFGLSIEIASEPEFFRPGDVLGGSYHVKLDCHSRYRAVEFSVQWYTEGSDDIGVAFFERLENATGVLPELMNPRSFECTLPKGPLSFNGASLKIKWRALLRAIPRRGRDYVCTVEFQLGPLGTQQPPDDDRGD